MTRGSRVRHKFLASKLNGARPVLIPTAAPAPGSWTRLAFWCDDTTVQSGLLQVIVGYERVLRLQDLRRVESTLPDNVYRVRAVSSWRGQDLCLQAHCWLELALQLYARTRWPA